MRPWLVVTIGSLLLSGLPPSPPMKVSAQVEERPADAADPDRICAPWFAGYANLQEDRVRQGSPRGFSPAPPVSPTAPPPPPPMQMESVGRIARPPVVGPWPRPDRERYLGEEVAPVQAVADSPVSTFGIDVDTGSYANVRRMLNEGRLPPQAAVRTEEMLNYFRYDYPRPEDRRRPFSLTTAMTTTPWNAETRLLRIGLRGYDLPRRERPPANLVFLVDVSGSMASLDKLPLVQCSLALVAEQVRPSDRVSIVVYAGAAGLVLAPTSDRGEIVGALKRLTAGGSTAGAAGIALAYRLARENRIEGGINRVILATDGDFNVGVTSRDALIDLVEREREAGVTLTTLGFGTGNLNEAMMEQVADHGNGHYAYIDSPREAQKVLDTELASTLFTIAQDVKIQIEFNPAHVSEYRLIGYENRLLAEQDFDNDRVDAGDIGAGHQVTALYEIVPAGSRGWLPERRYAANRRVAQGDEAGELAWLRLRYKLPGDGESRLVEQPVEARLLRSARAPTGDSAFAAAVAGFGQRLRGDPYLGAFSFADVERLARQARLDDHWRREFVGLARTAGRLMPGDARPR